MNQCIPSLCGETNILDIPDFVDKLPVEVLSNNILKHLYDRKRLQKCFTNKTLCLYGDSTLEENMHDIIVLLAGIGNNETAVNQYFEYCQQLELPTTDLFMNGIDIHFAKNYTAYHPHRRFDAYIKSINFNLHHIFTGHPNLHKNGRGITALIYRLIEEYKYIQSQCDIIILNSYEHDMVHAGPKKDYIKNIDQLFSILQLMFSGNKNNKKFYWKGQITYGNIHDIEDRKYYDNETVNIIRNKYDNIIKYINITDILVSLPKCPFIGHHIGQGDTDLKYGSYLWTSAVTQKIINDICND
jgi:hypothetical protein